MKVSILQYKVSPACEFVTVEIGHQWDPQYFTLARLVKSLLLSESIPINVNTGNPLKKDSEHKCPNESRFNS